MNAAYEARNSSLNAFKNDGCSSTTIARKISIFLPCIGPYMRSYNYEKTLFDEVFAIDIYVLL
jgi:hypothetical protein